MSDSRPRDWIQEQVLQAPDTPQVIRPVVSAIGVNVINNMLFGRLFVECERNDAVDDVRAKAHVAR